MCFSATASFTAGSVLGAAGVVTLAQTETQKEIPLASIPLLFGIQQGIEGIVWLSFGTPALNSLATYAYSIFSHVLWPVFVPIAILLIETDPLRKKMLRMCAFVGVSVGAYLWFFVLTDPIISYVVRDNIVYDSPHLYPLVIMGMYLVATCGSCLISSHTSINVFGVVLLFSFAVAAWFYTETFFSVWCFFAAILSLIIYWHFKRKCA